MTLFFHTLGCKVNQYETQAMRRLMEAEGYTTVEEPSENGKLPDSLQTAGDRDDDLVIVINSCTVTGESDRKLRQLLRRYRREFPRAVLVLTGCMPQAFPQVAEGFAEADIVLGNAARRDLPFHIRDFLTRRQRIVDIGGHGQAFETMAVDEFQGRTRAFVKIEDGCDRFCSYCIIPYARGRVRSKPLEDLRAEIRGLASKGYAEIVLVGINLNAYGREWGLSLCDAVEAACSETGVGRVRLGSLEPEMLTPDVIERFAAQKKLCPQFHLSLQSGCAATLKRMNRHYTPDEYAAVCEGLRAHFPDCALTTDVMVGFPGEDEKEFGESLAFVKRIGFSRVHVFAYSRRPGTPAAKAPAQVTNAEKTDRSHRMIQACRALCDAYLDRHVGSAAEVLLETRGKEGYMEGYSPQYIPVMVRMPGGGGLPPGTIVKARLLRHENGICYGEIV